MEWRSLNRGEVIAIVGAALLIVSVFLPSWFVTGNGNARISGHQGAGLQLSVWQTLQVIRWLLLAAASAPLILAYIVVRRHRLSWPRGEVTAIVAIVALWLIIVRGLLVIPGQPPSEIGIGWGWFVSLGAAALILVGALARSTESGRSRRPPGAL